jgi:glycosyltransferase involved in cell wall biosynthesis
VKIAIVHDWLTGMRGGEKVLLELLRLFPDADLFALFWIPGSVSMEIEQRIRQVSFLQSAPGVASRYRFYLPLFPAAVRSLDLCGYDLVLSSSHAAAKGARVPPGALHISYVHTPMRYVWETGADYFAFGSGRSWKRAALMLATPYLRGFELESARGVDFFVANSENVRQRIRRFYDREATVIFPPVDTEFFTPPPVNRKGDYYLVVSSLEPYKRIDLAVDAFSGGRRRLLIAGKGTLGAELRRRARPPVEFLGEVSNERLRELYRYSRALIFPGLEDFGIALVEAQACGCPVVCYGEGGAVESVISGRTGVHFRPQTKDALLGAVERLESTSWDAAEIRRQSLSFSRQVFWNRMREFFGEQVGVGWESGGRLQRSAVGADL